MPSDELPPDGPAGADDLADASDDGNGGDGGGTVLVNLPIEDELKESYLTYAMSVIVSRASARCAGWAQAVAAADPRGHERSEPGPQLQSRQMREDLRRHQRQLSPSRRKCDLSRRLVRMAQEWNMSHVLVDKQGNFGSIAGLPPAAMRYTEARLSPVAALMLDDLKLDTVDYIPTYDESRLEPTVLPSKFPNLLVNGAQGIAVGMATSIPPHNLREVCDALIRVIEEPNVSIDELMTIVEGPDFPTGGVICGRSGIRRGYYTGRSTVVVRARARIEERTRGRSRIVVSEIPYQQYRDRVVERIAGLVQQGRIKGISEIRDESDLKEPVRLVIEIKRDADPEVVLNQLYQFSPLQDSFSLIFLALVDGKPRELNFKQLLEEYIRHRVTVIRRRTQFLLAKARRRKHTVEGLLLALANIDEIIRVIRNSRTQAEAKEGLMGVECPAAMMQRALGERGYTIF